MEVFLYIIFLIGFMLGLYQGMVKNEYAKGCFHIVLSALLIIAYIASELKKNGLIG